MVDCQLRHLGCDALQFGGLALDSSETSVASRQTAHGPMY